MSVEMSKQEVQRTADKYPTALQGVRRLVSEGNLPDVPVDRIEVKFLASGEATYRYWTPRSEVPAGGYLPPA